MPTKFSLSFLHFADRWWISAMTIAVSHTFAFAYAAEKRTRGRPKWNQRTHRMVPLGVIHVPITIRFLPSQKIKNLNLKGWNSQGSMIILSSTLLYASLLPSKQSMQLPPHSLKCSEKGRGIIEIWTSITWNAGGQLFFYNGTNPYFLQGVNSSYTFNPCPLTSPLPLLPFTSWLSPGNAQQNQVHSGPWW